MLTESCENVANKFHCEKCDYNTSRKSSYDKHIMTSKHIKLTKDVQNLTESCEKIKNLQSHICKKCNKEYKSRVGLWKHNKSCINNNSKIDEVYELDEIDETNNSVSDSDSDKEPSSKDIIKMMKMQMIENQEIRSLIIELLKKETINNQINNNINNCNNKSFNMNFFLNEQCKDALNINEFVDSIKMQLSDLEEFAHLGYADGVSNIFVKGINALEVHLRPIHCSDTKREVLYIKNNNEWIKETDDKSLIKSAIKRVAFKNIRQINDWVKENPTCKDPTTKKYDQYNQIVMNAMSGVTEEEQKNNIEKIVRNVTKAVAIDKYALKN
jgi:hypothetical protein